MKIHEFNSAKGIYQFDLTEIETTLHAHPAIEMIYAKNGGVTLETPSTKYENITLAIIPANIAHKIQAAKDDISIWMIECHSDELQKAFSKQGIQFNSEIYTEKNTTKTLQVINKLFDAYCQGIFPMADQERIQACLTYLNSTSSEYAEMMKVLKSKTNLSDSRLSHLFKAEVGISIKKYLLWSKLKRAFEGVIYRDLTMYEAAFESGFYDQAHLSKAFKQLLGINPSKVYNSRTVQF